MHLEWWQRVLISEETIDDPDYRAIMTDMHRHFSPKTTEADIWQVRDFARYMARMTRFRL